jgi:hypothetical protein
MQRLRHTPQLARLVLAWFMLSLGVALASPLLGSPDMMLVCSGTGAMKLLAPASGDAETESTTPTMACPLCAGAAPAPACVYSPPTHALSYALQGIAAARLAARTAAPLPARGPPPRA